MGQKPTTYRGHLSIPGRLRPVRHILCFSEALMQNGTNGSVTVLHNDDTLIWASVISFLGLPALPEWAGPGVQMLRNTEKIRRSSDSIAPCHGDHHARGVVAVDWMQVAEKFLFSPKLQALSSGLPTASKIYSLHL